MAGSRKTVEVRVDGAPAPGRPWSATAIGQFHDCPLRYWWQKVERWETPSTTALVVGRAVHGALEHLLALPPDERVPARGDEFLARSLTDELALVEGQELDETEIREGAAAAMSAYWQTEVPADIEVAPDGLERRVDADLRGLPFLGHIDRIAVSDVGLRVTDYKTGAAKPRFWWGYWRQQLLYAAALQQLDEPAAEVELLYLKEPRQVTRPVYPAAVRRALDDLEIAHEERDRMATVGVWEARTGPLCNYCDFRNACPAQRSNCPPPGSPESNEILIKAGLTRRESEPSSE
ncbi:MAG: hypothetical protein B7C55_03085 [Actinomycetales bacterium mxb001]|nr:MAG: hypothetical protein B7C55_03085 [Actinomycetales bacterium mxb001]